MQVRRANNRHLSYVISAASIYTSMYVAMTLAFGNLSYGQLNFRVANLMLGTIPLLGRPGILGQTLGVLVTASLSPLGPVDLINVGPALLFSWLIWRLRAISVLLGLGLYSVGVGTTVSLTLHYVTGVPFTDLLIYVIVGMLTVTAGPGLFVYRTLLKSGLLQVQGDAEKRTRPAAR